MILDNMLTKIQLCESRKGRSGNGAHKLPILSFGKLDPCAYEHRQITRLLTIIFFLIFFVKPDYLFAEESVDVSFTVQAVQIQDIVKSQLSAKAHWSLLATDLDTGKRLI